VALTCFERDPNDCHRHCVVDAIAKRAGVGFSTLHIP
jgi:Fe-S-cluster-containing hydrogenase component 2